MSDRKPKPDPIGSVSSTLGDMLADGKSIADEVTDNAKAVARVALGNLGVVSRDEFDGQVAMLRRTRERVEQLESEISTLLIKIDELQNQSNDWNNRDWLFKLLTPFLTMPDRAKKLDLYQFSVDSSVAQRAKHVHLARVKVGQTEVGR